MRKGLIGCLVVVVLLVAVGAGLAWFYVLKPMVGAGDPVLAGARDWTKVIEAEQAIRLQSAYVPPADGRLTQDQVNRFVQVQSTLEQRLGPEFEVLEQLHDAGNAAAARAPGVAGRDLDKLVGRAREAQVDGMNDTNMSLAEYRWIRDAAYAALPFLDMDPNAIVAPKAPENAAVDAATGEIIEIPEAPPAPAEGVDPAEAMAADAAAVATDATGAPAEDSGLEYAGTAPDEKDLPALPAGGSLPPKPPATPAKAPDDLAETVKDRGLGDDSALDDAATQTARANAVLLRPHKELLLRTLGGSWVGL
jgi:hypothetical protein